MELKMLDKIQVGSTAGHIEHHNAIVDAINTLNALYMAIVDKMKEQCDGIDGLAKNIDTMGNTNRSFLESISILDQRISALSHVVESLTKPKAPSFAHTRVTNKAFVSGSEEILLLQHKVDSFGTYIIDTRPYTVDVDNNCRASGVSPMRIITVEKEEDMVLESKLLIEAHDKTTTEVSYDIEVFIYRIAD